MTSFRIEKFNRQPASPLERSSDRLDGSLARAQGNLKSGSESADLVEILSPRGKRANQVAQIDSASERQGTFGEILSTLSGIEKQVNKLSARNQGLLSDTERAAISDELTALEKSRDQIVQSDQFKRISEVVTQARGSLEGGASPNNLAKSLLNQRYLLGDGLISLINSGNISSLKGVEQGLSDLTLGTTVNELEKNTPRTIDQRISALRKSLSGVSDIARAVFGEEDAKALLNKLPEYDPEKAPLTDEQLADLKLGVKASVLFFVADALAAHSGPVNSGLLLDNEPNLENQQIGTFQR